MISQRRIHIFHNSLTHSMMLHLQRKEPFKADEAASVTPKIRCSP